MSDWAKIGYAAVDSGLLMISDPCYHDMFDYDKDVIGAMTLGVGDSFSGGHQLNGDRGVIFSTMYGDGTYPVFGRFEKGRLVAVKIELDFVPDDAELMFEEDLAVGF